MSEEYKIKWCSVCEANTYHEDGFCMEKIYGDLRCEHCLELIEYHDTDAFLCEKCGRMTCYNCSSTREEYVCKECADEAL